MSENEKKTNTKRQGNHAARLSAVQALYQIEQSGVPGEEIVEEFLKYRLHTHPDQEEDLIVNRKLFKSVVRQTNAQQEQIDDFIRQTLPETWTIDRLDSVLRAILRAGCGEFLMDKGTSVAIIINEYVNVTHDFYSGNESGFVNGVLDRIAHTLGLKKQDEPTARIRDFAKERNTSGVPNWEDEGGVNS